MSVRLGLVAMVLGFVMLLGLLSEAALRIGIEAGATALRQPQFYTSRDSNEYWRLLNQWRRPPDALAPGRLHPVLGYTAEANDPANPFGLVEDTRSRITRTGPTVLFYGASFNNGPLDEKGERIPAWVDRQLEANFLNMAVGGYHLDQVFLLFQRTHGLAQEPLLLVAVHPWNLDRLDSQVAGFRRKPYFVLSEAGELVLRGTPIEGDQDAFFRTQTPETRSYLLGFLSRVLDKLGWAAHSDAVEQRAAITTRIIEEIARTAAEHGLELHFVIYKDVQNWGRTGWQEAVMRETLDRLGIPYLETFPLLEAYAHEHELGPRELYDALDGHHSHLGNRVVAEGIAEYVRAAGYN